MNERTMIIRKSRAWVVRWESITDSPIRKKIIAIFDSRFSGERIRWFVEKFYMTQTCTPREMTSYVRNKAEFMINEEGMGCFGYIRCGHQPLVLATIVKDLIVTDKGDGNQEVSWTDIPMPRIDAQQ
jgi:hypothetical protein